VSRKSAPREINRYAVGKKCARTAQPFRKHVSQLLEANRFSGKPGNPSIMDAEEPEIMVEILATLACGIFAGAAV
jgi:hypothetical protein